MDSSLVLSPGREEGKSESFRAAGYLLQKPWLCALFGALLVAAWAGQAPLVMLTSLFLSAALIARIWARLSLKGITCIRVLREERFFPGESVEMEIRVANRKPLPLPWFYVEQELPLGISGDLRLRTSVRPEHGMLYREGSLLWYRSMRWRCRLTCKRRGYYDLGPMRFTSGDVFGFYTASMDFPESQKLIVYPNLFSVEKMEIPSLQPMGESRILRRIIQDPTRVIGLRDYRPGDSLRRIHWKASARSARLQVKTFEATTSHKTAIFLSVESFQGQCPLKDEEDFELAISAAASMARFLVNAGSPVGIFVNTRSADSGGEVSLPPGGRREQLSQILEALAKVTGARGEGFEAFLEKERRHLSAGTTLVLIFGRPPLSLPGLASGLLSLGYKVFVMVVGEEDGLSIDNGIPWKTIRNPEDLRRL